MVKNQKDALILRRLDEIEESVNLGTLDTTILGLMFFAVAIALALVPMITSNFVIKNPPVFVVTLVALILMIPLIQYVFFYAETIFFKGGRFTKKKMLLNILLGELFFIFEMWLFLFAAAIYEQWWRTPKLVVIIVNLSLLIVAVLISYFYIKPRVDRYFSENFKALLEKRERELKMNELTPQK